MTNGAVSKSITSSRDNLFAKNMTLSTPVVGQSVFLGIVFATSLDKIVT